MQFAQPLWLFAGVLFCALLAWLYRRSDRRQRAALSQFAAARLLPRFTASVSPARRRWKRALFLLGVLLLFTALARPQAGFTWQETHRQGIEFLFAVDTSKSMLAQDVKPDRLTRTKLAIEDLLTKLHGDGVGLIAFAGDAFLQCPVTVDYDAFRESVEALDTNIIPRGGTDIAAAVHEAQAAFKTRTAPEKILILLTDGEDLAGDALSAAKEAARGGVKIFTVGVGSATGELIPVPNDHGGTDFARDDQGQLVRSHLDESMLRQIATAADGTYQPLGANAQGLDQLYTGALASFARHDLATRESKLPIERFAWPLAVALLSFAAEMLIGNRRRTTSPHPEPPIRKPAHPTVRPVAAALALILPAFGAARAATPQAAEQAYHHGDYAKAQQEYKAAATDKPADAKLRFNAGSAAYKAGDYAQAANAFREGLKTDSIPLQQSSYYNLGNTHYRLGQKLEKTAPDQAIQTWQEALKAYDAALQISPSDIAAKHNRDLVQNRIDALKKQQEQKHSAAQNQQQQKQDNKQSKQDQPSQSQPQNNQSKSQQQQQSQDQSQSQPQNQSQQQQQNQSQQQAQSKGSSSEKQQQDQQSSAKPQPATDSKTPPKPDRNEQKQNAGRKQQQNESQSAQNQPQTTPDQKPSQSKAQQIQPPSTAQTKPDGKDQKPQAPKAVNAEKKPDQGQAELANPSAQPSASETAEVAPETREPGQMTREEARQLLDAMKGDLRPAPAISERGHAGNSHRPAKTLPDW